MKPSPRLRKKLNKAGLKLYTSSFVPLPAMELVSIQPMSVPSGLLFYLDYTYGSTVPEKEEPGKE